MNFLNLAGWEVQSVKQSANDYHVEAAYTKVLKHCPHCGMFAKVYKHGSRPQTLMDLPSHGKRVGIVLDRIRYHCQDCGKTFLQPLPDVDDGRQMTRRLADYISEQSIIRPFTNVAGDVGVDEKTVRLLFAAHVSRLEAETVFETPQWMGIDEVHLMKKPRCVLTNIKQRTIFGVLAQRTKKVVTAHLKTLTDRGKVEVVTMDMWGPYRDAVRDAMPKAVIVVDKFHVVRMANYCLEQVRKSFRAGLDVKVRRRLMHDRFVLLRREKDLKDEDKVKLETWRRDFPEIKEAHRLKEEFFAVYDSKTRDEAIAAFQQWEKSAGREMPEAYKPLLTAVYNWKDHIFAYFDHRATNALTEALNGIAKNIEREGRGYSFEAIRAKMLFSKPLLKPARRPKFGTEDAGRGTPAEVYGTVWGTDIDALLGGVETAAGQHEQSHFLSIDPRGG